MRSAADQSDSRVFATSRRVFGFLLRAYPASFRRACEAEMNEAFASDLCTAYRNRGSLGVLMLWVHTLSDLVRSAAAERIGWGSGRRHSQSREPQLQESVRRSRRKAHDMLHDLVQDIRYAARTLGRTPGFTAIAIVILALGFGANSTIFSIVNALFMESPPHVEEPGRLVRISRTSRFSNTIPLSYPDFEFYRDNNSVFSGVLAYDASGFVTMANSGTRADQVRGWWVTANYFDVLGTEIVVGRSFLPEEDRTPGTHPVAVISHGYWQRAFQGNADAVGATVSLNGHPFTVIGVAPATFRGVSPVEVPPDVWVPMMMLPVLRPGWAGMLRRTPGERDNWIWAMGRLRPNVTMAGARADFESVTAELELQFSAWNRGQGVALTQHVEIHPTARRRLMSLMQLLMGVVGTVLVIAGANIAILLLARGSSRSKEIAVRSALGAGRGRVVRQLLTESLVLAVAGGVVGFAVAFWSADAAAALIPVAFSVSFAPDLRVLAFTMALTLAAALLFGLAPALQVTRTDIVSALRRDRGMSGGSRLRSVLVVAQVALSLVLVTGAGLFVRSFQSAQSVDLGFDVEGGAVVAVNLQNHGYTDSDGRAFIRRLLFQLGQNPGVMAATVTAGLPLSGSWSGSFVAEGVEPPPGEEELETGFNAAGPGYFGVMGIPLVAGRGFRERDDENGPFVVVINETLANRLWPGQEAIGRQVARDEDGPWFTVVGVAANAIYYRLDEEPQSQMYFPLMQYYIPRFNVVARAMGDPAPLAGGIEREIRAIDPNLTVRDGGTLRDLVAQATGNFRVIAILVGLFGLVALMLSSVGLYGVLSYAVAQQTREIGIRVALGAERHRVARDIVTRGLFLAGTGVALGVMGALAMSELVKSMLFGVGPRDPVTFVVVPLVLLAVAGAASWLPARRATRVDPMVALRSE